MNLRKLGLQISIVRVPSTDLSLEESHGSGAQHFSFGNPAKRAGTRESWHTHRNKTHTSRKKAYTCGIEVNKSGKKAHTSGKM